MSFTWTAPPEGTGEVEVRFAVVRVFSTFWANQLAATLQGMNSADTEEQTHVHTPMRSSHYQEHSI